MKTYSFLDVLVGLTGPGVAISLSAGAGIADEGISFAFAGRINKMTIGAGGEGMNTLRADYSGTITVRCLKSSPVNQQLSAAVAFQRSNSSAHGQNTISVFDKNRGDTLTCQGVAFAKIPDITYAKDDQLVEWQFDSVRIDPALGA